MLSFKHIRILYPFKLHRLKATFSARHHGGVRGFSPHMEEDVFEASGWNREQ